MTTKEETRIELLLGVAAHPGTPVTEAETALAGARKVIAKHHLESQFENRAAFIGVAVAIRRVPSGFADMIEGFRKLSRQIDEISKSAE